jgi:DNA-binding transcriptional regulator YiaG
VIAPQWEFIEEAARSLGISTDTVRKWRGRGVPGRFRLPIVKFDSRHGLPLDPAVLAPAG